MPKKPKRNAFYFFMRDFKQQQREIGINYADLGEVAKAAGPSWTTASPAVRKKYHDMARAQKGQKYTSQGVSLAALQYAEQERLAAIERERTYITHYVRQNSINDNILDDCIYLMDVNCYCKARGDYLIGEFTLLRMTLRDGIIDKYHKVICPGGIPLGFALDVKLGAKELGLPMPGREPGTDCRDILPAIRTFMLHADPRCGVAGAPLPPLYTMPNKVAPCANFISQLHATKDENQFRVYRLDYLLFQLLKSYEDFPQESLALVYLQRDLFKYSVGLACERHEENDRVVECSMSRVQRWAFSVLDLLVPRLGLQPLPGRHLPADYDVESILQYKEEQQNGAEPCVAARVAQPPSPDTLDAKVNSSLDSTFSSIREYLLNATVDATLNSELESKINSVMDPRLSFALECKLNSALEPSGTYALESKLNSALEPSGTYALESKLNSALEPSGTYALESKLNSALEPSGTYALESKLNSALESSCNYALDPMPHTLDSTLNSTQDSNVNSKLDTSLDSTANSTEIPVTPRKPQPVDDTFPLWADGRGRGRGLLSSLRRLEL